MVMSSSVCVCVRGYCQNRWNGKIVAVHEKPIISMALFGIGGYLETKFHIQFALFIDPMREIFDEVVLLLIQMGVYHLVEINQN